MNKTKRADDQFDFNGQDERGRPVAPVAGQAAGARHAGPGASPY
ncbi:MULTISPECIES: hypothetical protein [Burkholderia cepacia complex]|nr:MULTISPECIES: hypothetical protein [Burkholderia cepacia complex]